MRKKIKYNPGRILNTLAGRKITTLPEEQVEMLPSLSQRRLLWAIHITNAPAHARGIELYMKAFQLKLHDRLTPSQREHLWESVETLVRKAEKQHFHRCYQEEVFQEYHSDRVLAVYELAEAKWQKSAAWLRAAFLRGFPDIEALLQLRRLGVGLPSSHILAYKRWYVTHFVLYFKWKRSGLSDVEFLEDTYEYLTPERVRLFRKRNDWLEQIIRAAPNCPIYGFPLRDPPDDFRGSMEADDGSFQPGDC